MNDRNKQFVNDAADLLDDLVMVGLFVSFWGLIAVAFVQLMGV